MPFDPVKPVEVGTKVSDYMLKGCEGREKLKGRLWSHADDMRLKGVCALGAFIVGRNGDSGGWTSDTLALWGNASEAYIKAYGFDMVTDNNTTDRTIPEIAARLAAIGY